VRLFYGARSPEAMAYRERVPEWEAAGVKVVPVFSEKGEGYVQDALAKVGGWAGGLVGWRAGAYAKEQVGWRWKGAAKWRPLSCIKCFRPMLLCN
jgi:hypothetical protein